MMARNETTAALLQLPIVAAPQLYKFSLINALRLSRNSLTTLSSLYLSLLGVSSETNTYSHTYGIQLQYDGDKHVRTYLFPLLCTYYYNVPRLVQFYGANTRGGRGRGVDEVTGAAHFGYRL